LEQRHQKQSEKAMSSGAATQRQNRLKEFAD
jgi:hypothetical protein